MIEYVVMDYDGEPVTIENGCMYEPSPPYDCESDKWAVWNSETCEWEFEPDDDRCGNDRRDYGGDWYDCNTDWRSW